MPASPGRDRRRPQYVADRCKTGGRATFSRPRHAAAPSLAHGTTTRPPFFSAGGLYTGVIDFGEIRGADPAFGLPHFRLHHQERVPCRLLAAVLDGYGQVERLPDARSIGQSAVLLGLRQLSRWLARGHGIDHPGRGAARRTTGRIHWALLAGQAGVARTA